jgi:hypothetical protein
MGVRCPAKFLNQARNKKSIRRATSAVGCVAIFHLRWAGYRRKRRQAAARVTERAQELMKELPSEAKKQA